MIGKAPGKTARAFLEELVGASNVGIIASYEVKQMLPSETWTASHPRPELIDGGSALLTAPCAPSLNDKKT